MVDVLRRGFPPAPTLAQLMDHKSDWWLLRNHNISNSSPLTQPLSMLDFYIKGEKYLAQFVLFSHNEILNGARIGSNEGCWTNVRRGSVTLLSQNWQLLLCTLLASHPNSAVSSHSYFSVRTPCSSAFPSMGQQKKQSELKHWNIAKEYFDALWASTFSL